MGELARRLDAEPRLYRALRPGAYAAAVYMARLEPRGVTRARAADRDQHRPRRELPATCWWAATPRPRPNYSLHTTGWAFDVSRRYRNKRQAQGFQYALDRLQALNLIAWAREPAAIHVTASEDADRLRQDLAD